MFTRTSINGEPAKLYRVSIQKAPALGIESPAQIEYVHIAAHSGIDALLTARQITGAYNAFDPSLIGYIGHAAGGVIVGAA